MEMDDRQLKDIGITLAIDAKIYNGEATNFASLLQLENRSNFLGWFRR